MSNTAPSTNAPSTGVIVGVDTHKLTHAAVAISALGARLGAISIPVNGKGYRALKAWAQSMGPVQAFGIEGTGSYGAGLSRFLCEHGHTVARGQPPKPPAATPEGQGRPTRRRKRRPCRAGRPSRRAAKVRHQHGRDDPPLQGRPRHSGQGTDPSHADAESDRTARALLGWSRLRLALRSATSDHIVTTYEKTGRVAAQYGQADEGDPIAAIRATLEAADVEFTNGKASGGAAAKTTPMTPDQVKAARVLLGWGLKRLAARSGTSIQMGTVFEQTGRVMSLNSRFQTVPTDAVAAIRTALEAAGVEFTNDNEPGVKLRKADR